MTDPADVYLLGHQAHQLSLVLLQFGYVQWNPELAGLVPPAAVILAADAGKADYLFAGYYRGIGRPVCFYAPRGQRQRKRVEAMGFYQAQTADEVVDWLANHARPVEAEAV